MGLGSGNDTSTSTNKNGKKKKKRSNSAPGRELENSGKSDISGLLSEKEIFKFSGGGTRPRTRIDSPRYQNSSDSDSSSRISSPTYYNSAMSDQTIVINRDDDHLTTFKKTEGTSVTMKVSEEGGEETMVNLKSDDINFLFSQLSMEEKARMIGSDFPKLFSQLNPDDKKKLLKRDKDTDALILSEEPDDILSRENNLKLRLDEVTEQKDIIKKQIKRARRNSGELKERMDLMDENRDLGAFQIAKLEQHLELVKKEEDLLKEGLVLEGQRRMNMQGPKIFSDKKTDSALQFLISERVRNEMKPLVGEINKVTNMLSEMRHGNRSNSSKKGQSQKVNITTNDGAVGDLVNSDGIMKSIVNPDPDDGDSSDSSSDSSSSSSSGDDSEERRRKRRKRRRRRRRRRERKKNESDSDDSIGTFRTGTSSLFMNDPVKLIIFNLKDAIREAKETLTKHPEEEKLLENACSELKNVLKDVRHDVKKVKRIGPHDEDRINNLHDEAKKILKSILVELNVIMKKKDTKKMFKLEYPKFDGSPLSFVAFQNQIDKLLVNLDNGEKVTQYKNCIVGPQKTEIFKYIDHIEDYNTLKETMIRKYGDVNSLLPGELQKIHNLPDNPQSLKEENSNISSILNLMKWLEYHNQTSAFGGNLIITCGRKLRTYNKERYYELKIMSFEAFKAFIQSIEERNFRELPMENKTVPKNHDGDKGNKVQSRFGSGRSGDNHKTPPSHVSKFNCHSCNGSHKLSECGDKCDRGKREEKTIETLQKTNGEMFLYF